MEIQNETEVRKLAIESAERYVRSKLTQEPHLLFAVKSLTAQDTKHLENLNQRLVKK